MIAQQANEVIELWSKICFSSVINFVKIDFLTRSFVSVVSLFSSHRQHLRRWKLAESHFTSLFYLCYLTNLHTYHQRHHKSSHRRPHSAFVVVGAMCLNNRSVMHRPYNWTYVTYVTNKPNLATATLVTSMCDFNSVSQMSSSTTDLTSATQMSSLTTNVGFAT